MTYRNAFLAHLAVLSTVLLVPSLSGNAAGAEDEGSLSRSTLRKFRSSLEMDGQTKAMYNAITAGDLSELALDREILRRHNQVFSHKIKTKGVTNQKRSGRCWLFAGLNIMRPGVIEN